MQLKVSLIGTGKVATQLAKALTSKGISIHEVVSKNQFNAVDFCKIFGGKAINRVEELGPCDLIIMAIKDDQIESVASKTPTHSPLVHTSGSVSMISLGVDREVGVFYPLQTFTKSGQPNWNEIPILLEAINDELFQLLNDLASLISNKTYAINTLQRRQLHLAAVFSCNFTNHLLGIANTICDDHHIPFELLHPLIEETFNKAQKENPFLHQTGPAVRNDQKIILYQMDQLNDHSDWQEIYKTLTSSIQNQSNE